MSKLAKPDFSVKIKIVKNLTIKIILSGLIALMVIGAGSFYAGFKVGTEQPKSIEIKGIANLEPDQQVTADFKIFWQAWQLLKDQHVKGAQIKDQDFIYGAISGLAGSFKDPNTVFFPPAESKKFEEDVVGNFGGIGAEIGVKNQQLVVIAPLENSPAEKAGLKAGDAILEIDGKNTAGIDVNDAVTKIRGLIGTSITLTILRSGDAAAKKITITRATIEIPTLKTKVTPDNIMEVQLFSFNQNAPFLFYKATLAALLGNASGMVLDLRNDPGGFLEVAVNIAGWFLEKGDIVAREKFRSGQETLFRADGNGALKNLPIVVLMNRGSASASEILAGALRDDRGIKLVGERSFGKGTVQELFSLQDNSRLKITIANWLLPKGQTIEENGLTPDVNIAFTEADAKAGKDPQLEKALEILRQEIATKQ